MMEAYYKKYVPPFLLLPPHIHVLPAEYLFIPESNLGFEKTVFWTLKDFNTILHSPFKKIKNDFIKFEIDSKDLDDLMTAYKRLDEEESEFRDYFNKQGRKGKCIDIMFCKNVFSEFVDSIISKYLN